jgi:hypothetical protein
MCAGAPKIRCLSSESQRVVPGDTEQETSLKVLSELLTSGNNQDVVGDGSMVKMKAEYLHWMHVNTFPKPKELRQHS